MRKLIRTTGVVFLILIAGMVTLYLIYGRPAPTPTAFVNALPLEQAKERAAELDRPVLVFATADWCIPCQIMKRRALRDDRVERAILEKTVPVYLDVTRDDDDEINRQADSLRIAGIPVLIAIRNGREVARLEGDRSAVELLSWLEQF